MSTEKPQGYSIMPTHADEAAGQIWIMDPAGNQVCAAAGDDLPEKMRHATRIAAALNLTCWWPSRERHGDGSPVVGKAGAAILGLSDAEDSRAAFFDDLTRHMAFLQGVAGTDDALDQSGLRDSLMRIVDDLEFAGMRIAWLESVDGKRGPVQTIHRRAFYVLGREPIDVINTVEADHAMDDGNFTCPEGFEPLAELLCAVPGCSEVYYAEKIGDEDEDVHDDDAIRFTIAAEHDIPPNWLLIETLIQAHLAACREIVASAPTK